MKVLLMALLTILAVQTLQAAYNDTGINAVCNGTIYDIYNKGQEAPSSDGKTHYYLNASKLDATANYLVGCNAWEFEDVDRGAGFNSSGVEYDNLTKRMYADFSGFQVRNYTDHENYTILYLNATTTVGARTVKVTWRSEINGTQGKINQTTAYCANGNMGQDLYAIERHFAFNFGTNYTLKTGTNCFTSNCAPLEIPIDGRHVILNNRQIEPYFIIGSDAGKSIGYVINNATLKNNGYWVEIRPNEVVLITNIGRINATNQCLTNRGFWIDATCATSCTPGCVVANSFICGNSSCTPAAANFYPLEVGTINKFGYGAYLSCAMGTGSCSGGTACGNSIGMDTGTGTFVNITSSTKYTISSGVSSCAFGSFYYAAYRLGGFYMANCSIRSEGNTTGSNGGVGFYYAYYAYSGGGWSDTISGNNTDRRKPNVTLKTPANNTNFTVLTYPYQVNLTCETNDSGYLNVQNTGFMNISVFNATTGTLYNSSLMYCSNFSHTCTKTAQMNFSTNGTFYWNCTVKDEAQLTNTTVPYWQFSLINAIADSGGRFFVGLLCIFVIGVYYAGKNIIA